MVEVGAYLAHQLGGLPLASEVGVEVGGVVRGFVAVGVLADEAGDVALVASAELGAAVEEAVEEALSAFGTANLPDPAFDVVRHVGAVLPAVGFGVVVVDLGGVEGGDEGTVAACVHKAVWVHNVLPRLAAARVDAADAVVADEARVFGYAPVVVGVFEGLADRLVLVFAAEEAVACVFGAAQDGQVAGGHHCVEQLLAGILVKAVEDAGAHRVEDDADGVIAYHTVCFVAGQLPHCQLAAVAVVVEHREDEVVAALRLDDVEQRMQGAVGVPDREDGVLVASFGLLDGVAVGVAVLHCQIASVGVAVEIGRCHTVI